MKIIPGNFRTVLLGLLLVMQVLWVVFHVWFVQSGFINPWKFGGYGMYTEPNPGPEVEISYLDRTTGDTAPVLPLETGRFLYASWDYNWRCKPMTEHALNFLWHDNPMLRGRDVIVTIFDHTFSAYPISLSRITAATIEVIWQDSGTYAFTQNACGSGYGTKNGNFNE